MAQDHRVKRRKSTASSSKKLKHQSSQTQEAVDISPSSARTASRASRKRASDFFDEEEAGANSSASLSDSSQPDTRKRKRTKVADEGIRRETKAKGTSKRGGILSVPKEPGPEPAGADSDVFESGSEEGAEDDLTAALLKGFESSADEDDSENEIINTDELPAIPALTKGKKLGDTSTGESDGPGVIYIGRVPHGFYEHQMRAYFSQFGDITQLRLSRNRKTGASKHYAFVEFASSEVAQIVADTMDKYLLFGHLLQVRVIPPEQVHENLFKGANKRYKPVPHNRIQARRLRQPMEKEKWEKRISNEQKRRKAREAKLKALGYEYEPPVLKRVQDLAGKTTDTEALPTPEDPPKALPDAPKEPVEEEAIEAEQAESRVAGVAEKAKARKSRKSAPVQGGTKAKSAKSAAALKKLSKTKKAKVAAA